MCSFLKGVDLIRSLASALIARDNCSLSDSLKIKKKQEFLCSRFAQVRPGCKNSTSSPDEFIAAADLAFPLVVLEIWSIVLLKSHFSIDDDWDRPGAISLAFYTFKQHPNRQMGARTRSIDRSIDYHLFFTVYKLSLRFNLSNRLFYAILRKMPYQSTWCIDSKDKQTRSLFRENLLLLAIINHSD